MLPFWLAVRVVSVALVVALGSASAWAEPLRVVVRVASAQDEELLIRVNGQIADLDVDIAVARDRPLELLLSEQTEAATRLARSHDAGVAIWFAHRDDGSIAVHVADGDGTTVLVRAIDPNDLRAASSSAIAELAAVTVRSLVRALLAHNPAEVIDPDPADRGAQAAEVPRPERTRSAPPPRLELERAAPALRRLGWHAAVGWQLAIDSERSGGQQGLVVRAGFERGPLVAGLAVVAGLPAHLDDELTEIELSRHAVGASIGVVAWRGERTVLSAEVNAGLLAYVRRTRVRTPDTLATPSNTTLAGVVGPSLHLWWRPFGARAPSIEVAVAADAVLPTPELVYTRDGERVLRNRVWWLQPRAIVALRFSTL